MQYAPDPKEDKNYVRLKCESSDLKKIIALNKTVHELRKEINKINIINRFLQQNLLYNIY